MRVVCIKTLGHTRCDGDLEAGAITSSSGWWAKKEIGKHGCGKDCSTGRRLEADVGPDCAEIYFNSTKL